VWLSGTAATVSGVPSDDLSAPGAAFEAEVDDPVGGIEEFQTPFASAGSTCRHFLASLVGYLFGVYFRSKRFGPESPSKVDDQIARGPCRNFRQTIFAICGRRSPRDDHPAEQLYFQKSAETSLEKC